MTTAESNPSATARWAIAPTSPRRCNRLTPAKRTSQTGLWARRAPCALTTAAGDKKRNASGDVIGTTRVQNACEKYRKLTGRIVAGVPPNAAACKYFSRKKED